MTTLPSAQRPGRRPATAIRPGMRIVWGRESYDLDEDDRWIYRWEFTGPDGGSVVAAVSRSVERYSRSPYVDYGDRPETYNAVNVEFTDGSATTFFDWSKDWREVKP